MGTWTEYKISTAIAFMVIVLIILPSAYFVWRNWQKTVREIEQAGNATFNWPRYQSQISTQEKQQIQKWIENNNLNQYGDPKNTVYAGGTPLFDESTNKNLDLYNYILKKHPDRPWKK